MIKICLLDLNGVGGTEFFFFFFFSSFSLNGLIPAGKEKDTWYHSPCYTGDSVQTN